MKFLSKNLFLSNIDFFKYRLSFFNKLYFFYFHIFYSYDSLQFEKTIDYYLSLIYYIQITLSLIRKITQSLEHLNILLKNFKLCYSFIK